MSAATTAADTARFWEEKLSEIVGKMVLTELRMVATMMAAVAEAMAGW